MKTDILIAGSGCSGLYMALKLSSKRDITVITKADLESSDSFLAQGGMCTLKEEADYDSFYEDTMRAGHYENDKVSVDIMIRNSPFVLADLLDYGAQFEREENGGLAFTREGAHSNKRIVFHEDTTGREITKTLLEEVKTRKNIHLIEHTAMIDIIEKDNKCYGVVVRKEDGQAEAIYADYTVWATGGVGGVYSHSTNFRHLTGDSIAIAVNHGIKLKDVDYVQIHPTTLYSERPEDRSFLISESVRGEGAYLLDKNGNRFVDELLPRDVVTKAIYEQMKKDGTDFVWEDLRPIGEDEIKHHFPAIVEHCREMGYDVFNECIPVVPAQHYFMGGIEVDHNSMTSMKHLYAVGETACNGVHGKNRLASNSLLESLVFAARAAADIAVNYEPISESIDVDIESYDEIVENTYADIARDAIRSAAEKRQAQ